MFSWNAGKARTNTEKHGVSFEEATTVFADIEALEEDIEHSETELRLKRLGLSFRNRILIVVYTLRRLEDGKETIRTISARCASRKERKAYAG